tara:strand:- start:1814 stop:3082 length:1269 start_codon:yes stop_codon:yes gene_type:complete
MKPQTARGVQDIPPEEKIIQNQLVDTLREIFELYGFAPLETPLLERYETLASKFAAGEDSDALKEIFKLKDQGKRKLGLRFDLTVPLARYVAMNPMLKMPFKRHELGNVFRDGPIKLGRARQFWQCDIDIIGTKSMLAEAELLAVVKAFFDRIKKKVVIKVNNRKLLIGILEQAGVKTKVEEAIISIDKLDKIGVKGVSEELTGKGFTKKQIKNIFELVKKDVSLPQLKKKITNEQALEGIKELQELFDYLRSMKIKVDFDVSLARGLAYYTGTVYEVFAKQGKVTSSLAAGGRYDEMIGKFGNREVPAVGVSFGLVPIMEMMKEKQEFIQKTPAQVFVIPIKTISQSLGIVQQLREEGIKCSFDLTGKGISKNLQYAGALGIPYVLFVGERELKQGKVKLRDMQTGDELLLSVKKVVEKLK